MRLKSDKQLYAAIYSADRQHSTALAVERMRGENQRDAIRTEGSVRGPQIDKQQKWESDRDAMRMAGQQALQQFSLGAADKRQQAGFTHEKDMMKTREDYKEQAFRDMAPYFQSNRKGAGGNVMNQEYIEQTLDEVLSGNQSKEKDDDDVRYGLDY